MAADGARKNCKPICIMWKRLTLPQLTGIIGGIRASCRLADIAKHISFRTPNVWMRPCMVAGKRYATPLDWCLERGRQGEETGYLNGDVIINCLKNEMFADQYTLVAVPERLYSTRKSGKIEVAGLGQRGVGAVMTVAGCIAQPDDYQEDYCRFLSAHELGGHAFGLVPEIRTADVYTHEDYGKHCTQLCVMLLGPEKKMEMRSSLRQKLFCDLCQADLRQYFAS